LVENHSHLSNVKKISRGKKFQSYSMGEMSGHGSRAPMGGAAGDSYTYYAGMEAVTMDDIHALFNSAEVCFYLLFIFSVKTLAGFSDNFRSCPSLSP
jgi:hypothetical protein